MKARFLLATCGAIGFCHATVAQVVINFSGTPVWPGNDGLAAAPLSQYVFSQPFECTSAVRSSDGRVEQMLHAPRHNFVAPGITTEISRDEQGRFHYRYTLSNGSGAKMPIQRWALVIEEPSRLMDLSHPIWRGGPVSIKLPGIAHEPNRVFQWEAPGGAAVEAGNKSPGFEVVSDLAPGFVVAVFYGKPTIPELTEAELEGLPAAARGQLAGCLSPVSDAGSTAMIGPRFSAETPVERVYDNFLSGVRRMKLSGRIGDAELNKQLESIIENAVTGAAPLHSGDRLRQFGRDRQPGGVETRVADALDLTLSSRDQR